MKAWTLRTILPLLLLFAGTLSSAQERPFADEVQGSALRLVSDLLAKDVKWLGRLNVKVLRDQLKQTPVIPLSDLEYKNLILSKGHAAVWKRAPQPEIYLNEGSWRTRPEFFHPAMAMHLYLQALGYDDNDGMLLSHLWLLTQDRFYQSFSKSEMKRLKSFFEAGVRLKEDSTIEGGTDFLLVGAKIAMLNRGLEIVSADPAQKSEFIKLYGIAAATKSIKGKWKEESKP